MENTHLFTVIKVMLLLLIHTSMNALSLVSGHWPVLPEESQTEEKKRMYLFWSLLLMGLFFYICLFLGIAPEKLGKMLFREITVSYLRTVTVPLGASKWEMNCKVILGRTLGSGINLGCTIADLWETAWKKCSSKNLQVLGLINIWYLLYNREVDMRKTK